MACLADDIQAAIEAHGMWKVHLREAIMNMNSNWKVSEVTADDRCPLGRWLYGDGRTRFPNPLDYEPIRFAHQEFHGEAARVLALAIAGRADEARAAMTGQTPFTEASRKLVSALGRLKEAAA